jgi:hypothetical protein
MSEEQGRAWLERQLAQLTLDAPYVGDFEGAMAAAQTLAILAGHMRERGEAGGGIRDVNVKLRRHDPAPRRRGAAEADRAHADPRRSAIERALGPPNR